MNTTHFLRALDAANHGEVTFTKQALDAFSIGGKWYPLRAVINFARENAGINVEYSWL